MRFSLFFEMQISNPTPETERQLFHDCAAQAVLADEVGFDGVLSADHVPSTTGPGRAGEAYTVGYIQALIERANDEVFS